MPIYEYKCNGGPGGHVVDKRQRTFKPLPIIVCPKHGIPAERVVAVRVGQAGRARPTARQVRQEMMGQIGFSNSSRLAQLKDLAESTRRAIGATRAQVENTIAHLEAKNR